MKNLRPALLLTLFFVVLTGLVFPVVVWGLGRTIFPDAAGGSLVRDAQGAVIGSSLLGQSFTKAEYFHPRPSAAGAGYDAASSGGTNLGPTSDKLVNGLADGSFSGFRQLAVHYREENGLAPDTVIPADAVTRSASGLDPEISPENARLQTARVARARGLAVEQVETLVAAHTVGRTLGLFGEPRVNVLKLNLAMDTLSRDARR